MAVKNTDPKDTDEYCLMCAVDLNKGPEGVQWIKGELCKSELKVKREGATILSINLGTNSRNNNPSLPKIGQSSKSDLTTT